MNQEDLKERRRNLGRENYRKRRKEMRDKQISEKRAAAQGERWKRQKEIAEGKAKKNLKESFDHFRCLLPPTFQDKCIILRSLLEDIPDSGILSSETELSWSKSDRTFYRYKRKCRGYLKDHPHNKTLMLKVGKQLATLDYAGFSDAGLHFENPSEHLPLKDFAAMRVAAIRQSLYTHKTNMREDLRIQNHQIAIQLYKVSLVQKYFSFCILFHYF